MQRQIQYLKYKLHEKEWAIKHLQTEVDNLKHERNKLQIINKALTEKLAGYITESIEPINSSAKKFNSISDIVIENEYIEKPKIISEVEVSITKNNSPIRSNMVISVEWDILKTVKFISKKEGAN